MQSVSGILPLLKCVPKIVYFYKKVKFPTYPANHYVSTTFQFLYASRHSVTKNDTDYIYLNARQA